MCDVVSCELVRKNVTLLIRRMCTIGAKELVMCSVENINMKKHFCQNIFVKNIYVQNVFVKNIFSKTYSY
jgi:hypothetical protein